MPYAILDNGAKLSYLDRLNDDLSFGERLALMSAAHRAFAQLKVSSSLARARGPFTCPSGSLVSR